MSNIIIAKKPIVSVNARGNSGVIRVDGETISILQDMAFQAHMSIGAIAGNLIKYAAADTVIMKEGKENGPD